MSQYVFGAGALWAVRNGGSGISTPLRFAVLQEVTIDFARTIKALFGEKNLPVALGGGTIKPTAKAKNARIFIKPYAELFFGQSFAAGQSLIAENEPGAVPDATAYTIEVENMSTFVEDLGVLNAATGLPLTRVAATPGPSAAGQYSVADGVYTFNVADKGLPMRISYEYEALTGQKLVIENQMLGDIPTFQAWFRGLYQGKQFVLKFFNCASEKLSIPSKLEDWTIPEFDFQMATNDADVLGELSAAE